MLERLRPLQGRLLRPAAACLVQWGLAPDIVTWFGTIAVSLVALVCFPLGWLWQGALAVAVLSVTDMLDGHMARAMPERDRQWGAFLDSSLDRVADAALIGGLAWHLGITGRPVWTVCAIVALVAAQVTSYVKARAEAVGLTADVGVVTRADRVALVVAGAFLAGVGVPWALEIAVALLALGGTVTVAQRFADVRRQCPR